MNDQWMSKQAIAVGREEYLREQREGFAELVVAAIIIAAAGLCLWRLFRTKEPT